MFDENYILKFGKYKGLPLKSVLKFDVQYLTWLMSKFDWFRLDSDFLFLVKEESRKYQKFMYEQQRAWSYGFGLEAKRARMKYNERMIDIKIEEQTKYIKNKVK